jgi:hypothetical protein
MIKLYFSSKSSLTKLRSFVVVQVVEMYFKVCKIATLQNLPLIKISSTRIPFPSELG